LVWGGDWNQALVGIDSVGSNDGRKHLLETIELLNLQVPTRNLLSRYGGEDYTIDHIAVPAVWKLKGEPKQIVAESDGKRLSDHDAYVIEVDASPP